MIIIRLIHKKIENSQVKTIIDVNVMFRIITLKKESNLVDFYSFYLYKRKNLMNF